MDYTYYSTTARGRRGGGQQTVKRKKSLAPRIIVFVIAAILLYEFGYKRLDPDMAGGETSGGRRNTNAAAPANTPAPTEEEMALAEIADYYKLQEGAANEKVYLSVSKIIKNYAKYPQEYIQLAIKHNDSIPFVADYIDFDENKKTEIDTTEDFPETGIPHFLQWDKRWGYLEYGKTDQDICIAGCGPTSLAMVVAGLTGRTDINPKTMADFAYDSGYYVVNVGTAWGLMSEGAKKFGLKVKELPLSESVIKNALNNGQPVIASMRPGTFTDVGHFIVLIGVDGDGKFIVRDPNSTDRSEKTWGYDVFEREARNFWAYSFEG